jgi:hypothetical protein
MYGAAYSFVYVLVVVCVCVRVRCLKPVFKNTSLTMRSMPQETSKNQSQMPKPENMPRSCLGYMSANGLACHSCCIRCVRSLT